MMQHNRLLSAIAFLAFDTETSDLFLMMHRLIEVGTVRLRLGHRELITLEQEKLITAHCSTPGVAM
jgi:hypothetical protein